MGTNQIYSILSKMNNEVAFVANVILTGHTKPRTKLYNLLALVTHGHDVRSAQFDISRIVIDGQHHSYSILDRKDCVLLSDAFSPNN